MFFERRHDTHAMVGMNRVGQSNTAERHLAVAPIIVRFGVSQVAIVLILPKVLARANKGSE